MTDQAPKPKYIFVDPNSSEEFLRTFQKILTERLLATERDTAIVTG